MKKVLFTLILTMILMLFGCRSPENNTVFDEPPALKIANGQSEIEAAKFGYTWETKDTRGRAVAEIADGADPFDNVDTLPIISILPTYVSTINPMNAYLMFEIVPDNVTARCWDSKLHNEDVAEIEILDAHLEDGTYCPDVILRLKNKNCIYEVTAEWNSYREFKGTATYYFRTDGEIINHNNAIVIKDET